jgi:4-hydroxythreonine-4-phosphate dehydrogenase
MDLKSKGKLVFGPFPADGFFAAGMHQNYDGVLAMYHDQGLVAFKSLAFETGVNFTAGLPVVRTSPDHGTAYSIAGKNQANENSFRYAMYLATDIIKNRSAQMVEK